ncbi:MAG: alpha/beta fold hydrolase BchO [Pseudomonadota bacterium]
MNNKLDFDTDGKDWPNRDASTFVEAGGLRFHAQIMGDGRDILLLHGVGASTHSFRDLMPRLARDFRVVAVDLPGHGFTGTPLFLRMTLPGVSELLGDFCRAARVDPDVVVGHSIGAALAIRMAIDGIVSPREIVGFNGSLRPYAGAAAPIFSTLARLLFINPFTPKLFAATASPSRVETMINNTGSKIPREGLDYYRRLFRNPGHVNGALSMMAGMDLAPLQSDLPKLTQHLTLVAAALDKTIAPSVAADAIAKVPHGTLVRVKGLGHLAHEEDPEGALRIIRDAVAAHAPAIDAAPASDR